MSPEVIGSTRRQLGLVRPEDIIQGKFARALVSALQSGDIRQSLHDFYTNWAPRTTAELLGLEPRMPWHDFPAIEYTLPWSPREPGPSEGSRRQQRGQLAAESLGLFDWHDYSCWKEFGPPTAQLVEMEARRLERVRDSITSEGFRVQLASRVLPFIAGKQSRFMVLAGHHRLACAVHLGYQQIPVIVNWGRPVVLRDHEGWPGVQKELFSSSEAVEIFGRYFVDQGL